MQAVARFPSNYAPENVPKPLTALVHHFPDALILMIFSHLNSYELSRLEEPADVCMLCPWTPRLILRNLRLSKK